MDTLRSIGARNRTIQSAARRLDCFLNEHDLFDPSIRRILQEVHNAGLFTTPVLPQPSSRLLNIPAEIRCIIYKYCFQNDYKDIMVSVSHRIQLALLLTCRQIHGEAYKIAFSTLDFHISAVGKRLSVSKRLSALGPLQMHLRRICVLVTPWQLQAQGRDNPFTLIQLPLKELEIRVLGTDNLAWYDNVNFFYQIVGAICHFYQAKDSKGNPCGPYRKVCSSFKEKNKRRVTQRLWFYKPEKKDLYHVLDSMRTKKVVVCAMKDVLSSAFVYFGLVSPHTVSLVRQGPNGGRFLTFYNGMTGGRGTLEFGHLGM